MPPNLSSNEPMRSLCVSVHDVAPPTWPQCQRLLAAIRAVADIPLTLMVVPAYHHQRAPDEIGYQALLEDRLARGDELALHGYTHLDEGATPDCWTNYFTRQVYGRGEAEFYTIGEVEARCRIEWGLEWFESRNWPVHGFVAPGWLMSPDAWQALEQFRFKYTTTVRRFIALQEKKSILAPSLTYSTRGAWNRALSRRWNTAHAGMLRSVHAVHNVPLIRLGLHPADADHPELIAHFQSMLARLLEQREPMTKSAFACRYWMPEQDAAGNGKRFAAYEQTDMLGGLRESGI